MHLLSAFCHALVLIFLLVPSASGQSGSSPADVRINIFRTGVGVFDRGEWAVIGLRGTNPRQTDVEATVVLYFENDTQTQYERKFWLPARSTRVTWLPVRTPDKLTDNQTLRAFTMNIIDIDDMHELQRGADPSLFTETFLPVSQLASQTGTIHPLPDPSKPDDESWFDPDVIQFTGIMRRSINAEPAGVDLNQVILPPFPYAYDSLDSLVISSDRWLDDSAAPLALRSWIANGGKVWLMLDKVSQKSVDALLGDDSCCEIVDRVELTKFNLNTPRLALADSNPLEQWESEQPVDFVRVLLSGDPIVHSRIGDWPASFSMRQGNGEVLITTLGARGWHHSAGAGEDPNSWDASGYTQALSELSARMLSRSSETKLSSEEILPILQSQIGYEVPARSTAGLLLGANCLLLLIAGVVLARINKLEHMLWVLPVSSVVAAGSMVFIGVSSTSDVPATVVSMQLLELSSGSDQVQASTFATFFSPQSEEFPLSVSAAGLVSPEGPQADGTLKRVSWDGTRNSHIDNFQIFPGAARSIRIRDNYILSNSVRAVGRFTDEGLVGELHGIETIGATSDAIVAAPISAGSGIELAEKGNFVCRQDQLLAPGEFLTGSFLTDQQQRRQEIFRSIFAPGNQAPYPNRPTLFIWSENHPIGVEVPEVFQPRGETLWAIPLELERTSPGSSFIVPATFIQMTKSDGQFGRSSVYNARTGKWMEGARSATKSMFQFVLPSQVMPARITTANISLRIHAPSREVQLLGKNSTTGEIDAIRSWQSPSGVLNIKLDAPEYLDVSSDQGLLFGVSVSDLKGLPAEDSGALSSDQMDSSTWKASYMRLSVSGETL